MNAIEIRNLSIPLHDDPDADTSGRHRDEPDLVYSRRSWTWLRTRCDKQRYSSKNESGVAFVKMSKL